MTHVAATTPYAWPFDAELDVDRLAVVVCGADDHWGARTPADPSASARLAALVQAGRDAGALVVAIHHVPIGRPAPTLAASAGPFATEPGDLVVTAAGVDGFYGSSLDAELRRRSRDQLLVAGHGFEATVHSTLRRANDRGYECLVVADACLCLTDELRAASISSIEMSGGIFGAVGATEHVIAALTAQPNR